MGENAEMRNNKPEEAIKEELDDELNYLNAMDRVLKRWRLEKIPRTEFEPFGSPLSLLVNNEDFLDYLEKALTLEITPDPGGVRRFFADFEAQIEDLDARWLLSLWRQESGIPTLDSSSLLKEYQQIYNQKLINKIKMMLNIPNISQMTEDQLIKWKQICERELVNTVLESNRLSIRQKIACHRTKVHNNSYSINEILTIVLREEKNRSLRYQAWKNINDLSQKISPAMQQAMVESNKKWQEMGYKNSITPKLQMLGIKEKVVREVITSIERITRPLAQSLFKEFEEQLEHEIRQWDWRYAAGMRFFPFENAFRSIDALNVAKKTYRYIGINIDHHPITFTKKPRSQKTILYPLRISQDLIISYNSLSGYRDIYLLLWHLGAACYLSNIDITLPYAFRRTTSRILEEGMATLSSWLVWDPQWLKMFTNLSAIEIIEFEKLKVVYELLKLRFNAGLALFEMDAYHFLSRNPYENLDKIYNENMRRFSFFPSEDSSLWAVHQRFLDSEGWPFYINYVLVLSVAANLFAYIHDNFDFLFSYNLGNLFKSNLVTEGAIGSWFERFQTFTSRKLTNFPLNCLANL